MKRRDLLKSLAATSVAPLLPQFSIANALATAPAISADIYNWATVLVRSHNNCTPAMLQRHLKIDTSSALILQRKLIENDVVTARADAYGMHKAVNPLFDDALMKPSSYAGQSPSNATQNRNPDKAYVALGGGAALPMN